MTGTFQSTYHEQSTASVKLRQRSIGSLATEGGCKRESANVGTAVFQCRRRSRPTQECIFTLGFDCVNGNDAGFQIQPIDETMSHAPGN